MIKAIRFLIEAITIEYIINIIIKHPLHFQILIITEQSQTEIEIDFKIKFRIPTRHNIPFQQISSAYRKKPKEVQFEK